MQMSCEFKPVKIVWVALKCLFPKNNTGLILTVVNKRSPDSQLQLLQAKNIK